MVPARRSNEPTARRRARRILGALFLATGLSVVAVTASLAQGSSEPDLSSVDPQGRDLAYTAAVNFLAGKRLNVPRADTLDPDDILGASAGNSADGPRNGPLDYQSLNWTGFSLQHFGSQKAGFTDFEIHRFVVVLKSPATPSPGTRAVRPSAGGHGAAPEKSPSSAASQAGQPPAGAVSPATPPAGASGTPSPSPSQTGKNGAAANPNVLELDVPVLLTDQGPRLAASPSFTPRTSDGGTARGRGDYTNYSKLTTDVSDATKNQILRWAKAYVSGDPAGLLAVTGDQDKSHHYMGLSGFTLPETDRSVQILSAINAAGDQVIVRVRLLLARPAGDRKFTTFADFDLLVGAPTGAQPPILAWGPAGSAAELEPYYNALSD